ncbi:outer membrane protein assembly factor BamD [Coprobacter sp. LH1063]|uniref:Outer membrane protein assembly factor BamD n=1 Tax=Coprobacter tertius TaxID=2944915 RepID=A0ABT1MGX6_9BACT|nr:outer membrane protein assembly factor BamD [Coprobacter tertius]MCP9611897.1 outer membrane protein assembly factor BamD [Coprobacter tertius]
MKKTLYLLVLVLCITSCGEYNKILKSTDNDLKYEYAKKYFDQKKYSRAYTLLSDLVTPFKGTDKAEESLYLLARSYFLAKDYVTSGEYFTTYYKSYPRGQYAELARFYAGYGYYLDSPEARLDQSGTYKAIDELQMFLEYYPNSEKAKEAQDIIIELQEKLAEKELYSVQLYYNLGFLMGKNNYEAAVITAQNALKDYPYSKYSQDFSFLILKSKYEEALHSIDAKKEDRFREVIDEYYGFVNDYPDSPNMKEAKKIFSVANKYVKD